MEALFACVPFCDGFPGADLLGRHSTSVDYEFPTEHFQDQGEGQSGRLNSKFVSRPSRSGESRVRKPGGSRVSVQRCAETVGLSLFWSVGALLDRTECSSYVSPREVWQNSL